MSILSSVRIGKIYRYFFEKRSILVNNSVKFKGTFFRKVDFI